MAVASLPLHSVRPLFVSGLASSLLEACTGSFGILRPEIFFVASALLLSLLRSLVLLFVFLPP